MARKKQEEKEAEEVLDTEPGDDVEEAQPSIEREDAAIGSTGGGGFGTGPGEQGGVGEAGNPPGN